MNAQIVSIGTELLLGQVTDTNATHIARRLASAGIGLYRTTAVGDNVDRIVEVLSGALAHADLIVTTGGLGPTVDDVTRDAVARVTGRPLVLCADLERSIRARIEAHGVRFTDNNRRQALIPRGATVIPNPVGTAPGFVARAGKCRILSLPGVPGEMVYLMEHWVMPYLGRLRPVAAHIASVELNVIGMAESAVDEALADLMAMGPNPTVGILCSSGVIQVRITARGKNRAGALDLARPIVRMVRRRLGNRIFGTDKTMAQVVLALLARGRHRLALIEQGTGGAVARMLLVPAKGAKALAMACTLGEGAIDSVRHSLPPPPPPGAVGERARWISDLAHAPVGLAAQVRRRGAGGTLEVGVVIGARDWHHRWTWTRALTDIDGRLAHRALDCLRRALLAAD